MTVERSKHRPLLTLTFIAQSPNIFGTDFNIQRNIEKKRLTIDERTNVRKCPED